MTEPQSSKGAGPTFSTNPGESGNANLIYVLFLAGLVTGGIATLVGLVMAYMAKDAAPDWLKSHYHNQINIFWKGLVYSIVGSLLTVVLIGVLILLFALIWYIVRIVKGMQNVSKGEAYPDPSSWGF